MTANKTAPEESYRTTLQNIIRRFIIVDLVLFVFAIGFWLVKRSLTPYDFANALSTVGFFAVALGCLSLSFSWGLKNVTKKRTDPPGDLQNPALRRFIDLAEANVFLFTMLISGALAIGIGWLLAVIFLPL
jgi:hypothetical protein